MHYDLLASFPGSPFTSMKNRKARGVPGNEANDLLVL